MIGLSVVTNANAGFISFTNATFNPTGPSGIPNDAVEVTTIKDGGNTITLGLAASPSGGIIGELANNGGSTFFDDPGLKWNFDYYANVTGAGVSNYKFILSYVLVPGTPSGTFNLSTAYNPSSTTTIQDSQNLGFSFLKTSSAFITPPTGSYNINATGDYQFVLSAYSSDGLTLLGQDTIDVAVGPVPEPSTYIAGSLMLLPFGMSALRFFRKQRPA